MFIPIHIIQSVKKAAEADVSSVLATSLRTGKPSQSPKGHVQHTTTAGRIWLAALIGVSLAGVLIGVSWGGVGIRLEKEETSVRPGINAEWAGPNVAPMIARLESDARELYAHRSALAALVGVQDGDDVADIGAGSGFMTEEFSRLVGVRGRVYAVETNPALVELIKNRATARNLTNVRPHLGEPTKINMSRRENGNFDYVFIADAYHHFEYPQSMLRSIERLLRRRGRLTLVEPRRVPGQSSEAILQHVRSSQAEVIRDVTAAGFELVDEPSAPFLKEYYVLRFRKK